MLVAIALASFVLILFLKNLSVFGLTSLKIEERIKSQDEAISVLFLLKHQIESAAVTECTTKPLKIVNLSGNPDFNSLAPYQILNEENPLLTLWKLKPIEVDGLINAPLLVHQPSETFYLSQTLDNTLLAPKTFSGSENDLVVIDDCNHALIAPITHIETIYGQGKLLTIKGFNQDQFTFPISVSLISDRVYYLSRVDQKDTSDYALYYAYRAADQRVMHEEMIPDVRSITYNEGSALTISVKPAFDNEVYHVTI